MSIKLIFNQEQLSVINEALMQMPYRISAPLIQDINKQIQTHFDFAKGDDPTGQTTPKDEFLGD